MAPAPGPDNWLKVRDSVISARFTRGSICITNKETEYENTDAAKAAA